MKPHGNSLDNQNEHHLYEIFRIVNEDTYKYGITDDPIEADGLSERARRQKIEMNRVAEYDKFDAQILITEIQGREAALNIEREYIDAYYNKHGRNPSGNLIPKRKN